MVEMQHKRTVKYRIEMRKLKERKDDESRVLLTFLTCFGLIHKINVIPKRAFIIRARSYIENTKAQFIQRIWKRRKISKRAELLTKK